jgi:AraC-like DNA-binding protein
MSEPASIPAAHAVHLAQLLEQDQGVASATLLGPLGMSLDELMVPGARLVVPDLERLVMRAVALSGDPALGVRMGLGMQVAAHGYLGFAAMTAPTIGEALQLAVRFAPTHTDALRLDLHVAEGEAALIITELVDLGAARETVVTALMIGLARIGAHLTGRPLPGTAELGFDRPSHIKDPELLGASLRFGCPAHRLLFDAALLDEPVVLADPVAARLAREQCENQLALLSPAVSVAARARELLARHPDPLPSAAQLARRLAISMRTLARRLGDAGTSYRELVDQTRRQRALLLLARPSLDVSEVARRLGYSDTANFSRAFRRWTGMPPGKYRRR